MAILGITPPSWLKSHTILLYKNGDPTRLDNPHPIALANALYKLWTTCIVIMATDYIEARKIPSPEQEGFLCYFDFKGAFPSTDHRQRVRVLDFMCLP